MPLRRLATMACIVCLLLVLVGPHFHRHGWTELGGVGIFLERWHHHPVGTITIVVVLASWLLQPRSNG